MEALPNSWVEKIQQVAKVGTPDFLMCIHGVFVALELKKDAKAPIGELQKYKLQCIRAAGGISIVVYPENWETTYQFLQQIAHKGFDSLNDNPLKETATWDLK